MVSKRLVDYFGEGLQVREDGRHPNANPYCAGSDERREWAAGFGATVAREYEDSDVRPAGR